MKLSFTFFILCGFFQKSFTCPSSKNKEPDTTKAVATSSTTIDTTTTVESEISKCRAV